MKYLIGYECDFEEKIENLAKQFDTDDEELAEKLCKVFGFDENTKVEELSVLDIIPGLVELLLGIPSEILTKPMMQLTKKDEMLCDEAINRVTTVFTSNKA
jgi:hypothetical protein